MDAKGVIMNIALIGLGVIAEKYISAMETEKDIRICYVCDIRKTLLAKELSSKYEFFYDYHKIPVKNLDYIFITTPPETHYEITSYFLGRKANVLLEKPATPDLSSLEKIIAAANDNRVLFDVIFHWRFGNEAIFLQNNPALLSDFTKISVVVQDPYFQEGKIIDSKLHLGGAWLDSGVNALSFLADFIDLNQLVLVDSESRIDSESGFDYYAKRVYHYRDALVEIIVDWNPDINKKQTFAYNGDRLLYVDHSNQAVYLDNKLLYQENETDRLVTHYHNFFSSLKNHAFDLQMVYDVHKVLFSVKGGNKTNGQNEKD